MSDYPCDLPISTAASRKGYRLLMKRPGDPLWRRVNVIAGPVPRPSTPIPCGILSALIGQRSFDVSPSSDRDWPFDLLMADDALLPGGKPNMVVALYRVGFGWINDTLLVTRRGGQWGAYTSISNPDDRDLELLERPVFGIGLLTDSAVDPVVYDLDPFAKAG